MMKKKNPRRLHPRWLCLGSSGP